MSAKRMATEAAQILRLDNGQPCNTDPVLEVVIVPPLPVTSELFLAYTFDSPRDRFETFVFASGGGNWDDLPDIRQGDQLVWTSQNVSYQLMGIEPWIRQSTSPFNGQSYWHILIEEVTIS